MDARAPATPDRVLRWDGCVNVRDLGGLPLADGGETAYRIVVRADWLPGLSDVGRRALVDYGVSLIVDLPGAPKSEFPGTGPGGNGISPNIKSQAQLLDLLKTDSCWSCHQLGTKATREISPMLGKFDSPAQAWERRVQSGQAGGQMLGSLNTMGKERMTAMFGDWTAMWRHEGHTTTLQGVWLDPYTVVDANVQRELVPGPLHRDHLAVGELQGHPARLGPAGLRGRPPPAGYSPR